MGVETFPLTPIQEEILLQTLRQPLGAGVYLAHLVLRIREGVDVSILAESCQRVQIRHSSLRTHFDWSGEGEPVQVVSERVDFPFISEDWRGVPESEQKGRLRGFLIADRFNGFNLNKSPLLRVALLRLGRAEYRLVWTFHQIIMDNHSIGIVVKEVLDCYRTLLKGLEWSPPPAPDFGRFALWLKDRQDGSTESFWRTYLEGFTSPTPVPPPLPLEKAEGSEKRQEPGDTVTTARERRILDRTLTAGLSGLAAELGLSVRSLLWGAWAIMLGRHSGRGDVLFAVVESIRHLAPPEFNGVGNYLNTVPFRVGIENRAGLGEWLAQLTEVRQGLTGNEVTALSRIRPLSAIPGEEPLFETYLAFEEEPPETSLKESGVDWAGLEVSAEIRTPVPLMLSTILKEELTLELEYDRRRYEGGSAAIMVDQVETILRGMVDNPEAELADLPILTRPEARRLFQEWQPPAPEELKETRIHRVFESVAARHPQSVAVRQGEERITYGRLEKEANRWARHLQSLGVGPENLVGLCLPRSIDQMIILLAILKAGGAYLPLDPEYPLDRLNYMIEDAGVDIVVTFGGMENRAGLKAARLVILEEAEEEIRDLSPTLPECGAKGENLAYLIYTSGSTGRPKGVMVEHRALANHILNSCSPYAIRPEDRCLQFASISFDAATEEIFIALLSGATLVLRTEEMSGSVSAFLTSCREWGLTVLGLPTAFWHVLAGELEEGGLPPKVRMAIIGGEAARPDKLALWQAKVGSEVVLFNCYGPTETTIGATLADLSQEPVGEQVSIGRPMNSLRAFVLDRHLRPVPQGAPGELFLAGRQLARGYLNRERLTAERFPVLNPLPPEFRGGGVGCRRDAAVPDRRPGPLPGRRPAHLPGPLRPPDSDQGFPGGAGGGGDGLGRPSRGGGGPGGHPGRRNRGDDPDRVHSPPGKGARGPVAAGSGTTVGRRAAGLHEALGPGFHRPSAPDPERKGGLPGPAGSGSETQEDQEPEG